MTARVLTLVPLLALSLSAAAQQMQKIGDPPEAMNMRLVAHEPLQARSAYQPIIARQGNRYIAYVGHHGGTDTVAKPMNPLTKQAEFNGTSIVDVTDPSKPRYLKHIPGQEGLGEAGGGQMVRVCDGKSLPKGNPNAYYLLRTFGGQAHEVWDVTAPENPKLLSRMPSGKDTHKNWWECDTGIAFLVSGLPEWRTRRMTEVYDLSDPAKPVKIREFGLPGQQPGASGAAPTELHGAISLGPKANRVYFGYGTNKSGILQIVDREKLLKPVPPTAENLAAPEVGRAYLGAFNGAHSVIPLGRMKVGEFSKDRFGAVRDFVMIVNESLVNECGPEEARQMVFFADITSEQHPMIVSNFNVPEAPGNFCSRGGRFGSHSANESSAPVFYQKLAFVTWFNAGVRAIDIRDPYRPREVGYFIPAITAATDKRCVKTTASGGQACKTAIQSNNLETDDRGYIYVVDRANTGLHILEVTGEARSIAGLP